MSTQIRTTTRNERIELASGEHRVFEMTHDISRDALLFVTLFCVIPDGAELTVRRAAMLRHEGTGVDFRLAAHVYGSGRLVIDDDIVLFAARTVGKSVTRVVLEDSSRSQVRARMTVERDAHRSVAYERMEHMMLGDETKVEGIPELDVRVDDVSARHAAGVFRPDARSLAYLASRGCDAIAAGALLADGFLLETFSV